MPCFESGSHWAANMTWHLLTLAHHNARRQFCQMDPQTLHQTISTRFCHLHLLTLQPEYAILLCAHTISHSVRKNRIFGPLDDDLCIIAIILLTFFNVSSKIKSDNLIVMLWGGSFKGRIWKLKRTQNWVVLGILIMFEWNGNKCWAMKIGVQKPSR